MLFHTIVFEPSLVADSCQTWFEQ